MQFRLLCALACTLSFSFMNTMDLTQDQANEPWLEATITWGHKSNPTTETISGSSREEVKTQLDKKVFPELKFLVNIFDIKYTFRCPRHSDDSEELKSLHALQCGTWQANETLHEMLNLFDN